MPRINPNHTPQIVTPAESKLMHILYARKEAATIKELTRRIIAPTLKKNRTQESE